MTSEEINIGEMVKLIDGEPVRYVGQSQREGGGHVAALLSIGGQIEFRELDGRVLNLDPGLTDSRSVNMNGRSKFGRVFAKYNQLWGYVPDEKSLKLKIAEWMDSEHNASVNHYKKHLNHKSNVDRASKFLGCLTDE